MIVSNNVNQCYVVNNLIESLKSSYYTDVINEHSSDQKMFFKTVGKLLQKSTNLILYLQ